MTYSMSMLAAAAQPSGKDTLISFLPLILIFVVMMFFMSRSQKKQAQKRQQMIDSVVKGARVLLQSGMFGQIVEVKENSFIVAIADNVKVEVLKSGVAEVVPAEGAAAPAAAQKK